MLAAIFLYLTIFLSSFGSVTLQSSGNVSIDGHIYPLLRAEITDTNHILVYSTHGNYQCNYPQANPNLPRVEFDGNITNYTSFGYTSVNGVPTLTITTTAPNSTCQRPDLIFSDDFEDTFFKNGFELPNSKY